MLVPDANAVSIVARAQSAARSLHGSLVAGCNSLHVHEPLRIATHSSTPLPRPMKLSELAAADEGSGRRVPAAKCGQQRARQAADCALQKAWHQDHQPGTLGPEWAVVSIAANNDRDCSPSRLFCPSSMEQPTAMLLCTLYLCSCWTRLSDTCLPYCAQGPLRVSRACLLPARCATKHTSRS